MPHIETTWELLMSQQLRDLWTMQLWATAGFFGLCLIEGLFARKKRKLKPPPELVTDMFYWLTGPSVRVLSRMLVFALLQGLVLLAGLHAGPELLDGFGPLAQQPKALIVVEALLIMDFAGYWTHRAFHQIPLLWRFHAVHHSAKHIRWATTGRVHPVNEIVVLPLIPLVMLYAMSAHLPFNLDYGPLRYVMVSPLFHRWHHTYLAEGCDKNFGNGFSIWDALFGTFYMPTDRLPHTFGVDSNDIEESYLSQLVYPFRRSAAAKGMPPAGG